MASKSMNGNRGIHETEREYPLVAKILGERGNIPLANAPRGANGPSEQRLSHLLLDDEEDNRYTTIRRLEAEMVVLRHVLVANNFKIPTPIARGVYGPDWSDSIRIQMFPSRLDDLRLKWFDKLPPGSIRSFFQLFEPSMAQFVINTKALKDVGRTSFRNFLPGRKFIPKIEGKHGRL
ncbi:hypothetical protein Acr_22g0005950 [Actinidia rufa]|uniref:Uncharacterized protein n=1 Tax=Actinidia rufa TaxID=165716 RepID=A0A7J0GK56_9ERIC|nr:hypothetical protein Acr_22g0005950 [Actinidia rufa]